MLAAMSEAIAKQIHDSIAAKLSDAEVEVTLGTPGHYSITVASKEFDGKSLVAKQRLVYSAISHLMGGDEAPVHAIDKLTTKLP